MNLVEPTVLVAVVWLVVQFAIQVAAVIAGLFIWDRTRRRPAR